MMLARLELVLVAVILVAVITTLTSVPMLHGALHGARHVSHRPFASDTSGMFYVRQASSRRAVAETVVYQKQANGMKY